MTDHGNLTGTSGYVILGEMVTPLADREAASARIGKEAALSHPKDDERTRVFVRWIAHVGGADPARALLAINSRTFERLASRRKPPPVSMLHEVANRHCSDPELADALRAAAQP